MILLNRFLIIGVLYIETISLNGHIRLLLNILYFILYFRMAHRGIIIIPTCIVAI